MYIDVRYGPVPGPRASSARVTTRGAWAGRKPGASLYTRKRLSRMHVQLEKRGFRSTSVDVAGNIDHALPAAPRVPGTPRTRSPVYCAAARCRASCWTFTPDGCRS
jgi:hypothetical protein